MWPGVTGNVNEGSFRRGRLGGRVSGLGQKTIFGRRGTAALPGLRGRALHARAEALATPGGAPGLQGEVVSFPEGSRQGNGAVNPAAGLRITNPRYSRLPVGATAGDLCDAPGSGVGSTGGGTPRSTAGGTPAATGSPVAADEGVRRGARGGRAPPVSSKQPVVKIRSASPRRRSGGCPPRSSPGDRNPAAPGPCQCWRR